MFICPIIFLVFGYSSILFATPPAACFAKFRWDDCGKPAVPVVYYWRPGSRCEVGLWRGCLPNLNMFQDEYECVATCIYTSRAAPGDYHAQNAYEEGTEAEEMGETTSLNSTDVTGVTTPADGNTTGIDATTIVGGGGGNETATDGATNTTDV